MPKKPRSIGRVPGVPSVPERFIDENEIYRAFIREAITDAPLGYGAVTLTPGTSASFSVALMVEGEKNAMTISEWREHIRFVWEHEIDSSTVATLVSGWRLAAQREDVFIFSAANGRTPRPTTSAETRSAANQVEQETAARVANCINALVGAARLFWHGPVRVVVRLEFAMLNHHMRLSLRVGLYAPPYATEEQFPTMPPMPGIPATWPQTTAIEVGEPPHPEVITGEPVTEELFWILGDRNPTSPE